MIKFIMISLAIFKSFDLVMTIIKEKLEFSDLFSKIMFNLIIIAIYLLVLFISIIK